MCTIYMLASYRDNNASNTKLFVAVKFVVASQNSSRPEDSDDFSP